MTEKQRKSILTTLKIVISVVLIYFIFTKINFGDVIAVVKKAHIGYLILALFLFIISKTFNALRLNLYFHSINIPLTHVSNFKLYILGMFYNLFLPGGIGGDAYKGYVIKKKYKTGTRKIVSVLLLDRLSGMLLIGIFACIFAVFVEAPVLQQFTWLFVLAIPLAIVSFWLVVKKYFSYTLGVFWTSFFYSFLVQGIQLLAILAILQAIGITLNTMAYLFIFMVSSVVSVIPLTIGGIGSREVTFLYGSHWLGLQADTAIGISFVFFIINALVSLAGIIYHLKKPELHTNPTI
ncbi:lysylphosphatidylglycerol synthase transmembrane domain-containing protein [Croceivirga sp. JEA036]|uniref:lysylphosphatidylglycerol synthase transmembrane domain-containing protein n=1 Tax=Croceivirga sp. JEA036 TaxID=2721162 RepID=UPI00143C51A4|nr:lysylphosphatidylglycerol synthase transmembrane domain-containing protein [Croceivirga sp. JEA036]NJB37566.1 flippase-like domain-containing protein [Croceivirga sp. JEA036]